MKPFIFPLIIVALVAAFPSSASAHFLWHRKHLTTEQRVRFYERSVEHDRAAITWAKDALDPPSPMFVSRRPVSDVLAEQATLQGLIRWHRAALKWHRQLLAEARAKLVYWTGDFVTATYAVERIYGSAVGGWLRSCSGSEGGHGRWVTNRRGSGAGGNMQFMRGTFYAYVNAAFRDARRRGLRVSERARSWYSALGQAVTAGYMRYYGLDGEQWTGETC